jgi:molybdopterin/thiamine biosynthesis adenylyltransferase
MSPPRQSVEEASWREDLVTAGFSDDGRLLRGPVTWAHPIEGPVTAQVEIEADEGFPFAPPQVRITTPGTALELTFHMERPDHARRPGGLCLWDDAWPVDQAPWLHPQILIERIADWLRNTATGWPDDEVCDLERYLKQDPDALILYDSQILPTVIGKPVRVETSSTKGLRIVTGDVLPIISPQKQRRGSRMHRRLAWVGDLGPVSSPIRDWTGICEALGTQAVNLSRDIALGLVDLLMLRYQRGSRESVLALRVRADKGTIDVTACESADTSTAIRQMRAGTAATDLAETAIAIVGCGAIGSFAAELLFRSGVRRLSLYDYEFLRPGNLVRHAAGNSQIGARKADAVRVRLTEVGLPVDRVKAETRHIGTLNDAIDLLMSHHVVLDATGSARTSSVLASAASIVGPGSGRTVVSVCVQREGGVIRVDRFPLRSSETHLQALPGLDQNNLPYENGCGSPVSRTPPTAVVAAAELATRVVIDEATCACSLPATLLDVRTPQHGTAYDRAGWHTSAHIRTSTAP